MNKVLIVAAVSLWFVVLVYHNFAGYLSRVEIDNVKVTLDDCADESCTINGKLTKERFSNKYTLKSKTGVHVFSFDRVSSMSHPLNKN